ncbi:hypothetical protein ACWEN6_08425 [Sphaerisporangium sp. NPDC004334]
MPGDAAFEAARDDLATYIPKFWQKVKKPVLFVEYSREKGDDTFKELLEHLVTMRRHARDDADFRAWSRHEAKVMGVEFKLHQQQNVDYQDDNNKSWNELLIVWEESREALQEIALHLGLSRRLDFRETRSGVTLRIPEAG